MAEEEMFMLSLFLSTMPGLKNRIAFHRYLLLAFVTPNVSHRLQIFGSGRPRFLPEVRRAEGAKDSRCARKRINIFAFHRQFVFSRGTVFHKYRRVSFIAFSMAKPALVMEKIRFRLPPRSLVAPPTLDLHIPCPPGERYVNGA